MVRILQLSDLHVDLLYDEGSAAYCDHPNCCRHAFGNPAPGEVAAGHWGTLANCDIPLHTLDDLLAHAALTDPHLVLVFFCYLSFSFAAQICRYFNYQFTLLFVCTVYVTCMYACIV